MADAELTAQQFAQYRELIYRLAGIRIPETKRVLVMNRVRRRLRATGIADFGVYYAMLTSPQGVAEQPLFLDAITTNETYFDRDPAQFDWFQKTYLPEVADAARTGRPPRLRVWSAACSTGEEVYSLALRIHEERARLAGWDISILGTDLSGEALATAREASYTPRSLRLISPERRQKGFDFDPVSERYAARTEIRTLATWRLHNLLRRLQGAPFDCIFLKNVLIYFDTASKQVVVENVLRSLSPGGYLVTGMTEGVSAMLDPLARLRPWLHQKASEPASHLRS